MNLRLLRIFHAVCQTQSITKAAESLHMTQPAVSLAIQDLEKETGLILFDRLGRRIHLTEMGSAYLDKALPLLDMCDVLDASTSQIRATTPLRIGCCLTIAQAWLPGILAAFARQYDTPVHTAIAGASQVLALLRDNQIDLALYEGVAPPAPFVSRVFSRYRLVPVCAREHPFAGQTVSLDAFLKEPLLLRETGSAIRDVMDSYLRLKGLRAEPIVTSTNSQALLQLLRQNLGVGILADKVLPPDLAAANLATFAVEGMQLLNDNRVVYHRDKRMTEAMEAFLATADAHAG